MTGTYQFLANYQRLLDEAIVRSQEFLADYRGYSARLQRVRKQYAIDTALGFNIFTSISDLYRRENLHSDILALILHPQTDRIGTSKNAKILVELLETKFSEQQKILLQCNQNLVVEREKGRVDVLIHDNAYALIIENKINEARDQNDQLPRYVEYCDGKNLTVEAIIYLPLCHKQPSFDYSQQY